MIAVFAFLYSRPDTPTPRESDSGGINFISQFNPFGKGKTTPRDTTQPVDISGYEPGPEDEALKLKKISSMPVAGFGIFQKERLSTWQMHHFCSSPALSTNLIYLIKKGITANEMIKEISPLINGSGGGRPQLAQAGSKEISKVDSAIRQANKLIKKKIIYWLYTLYV